jgi:hypothetical protein
MGYCVIAQYLQRDIIFPWPKTQFYYLICTWMPPSYIPKQM